MNNIDNSDTLPANQPIPETETTPSETETTPSPDVALETIDCNAQPQNGEPSLNVLLHNWKTNTWATVGGIVIAIVPVAALLSFNRIYNLFFIGLAIYYATLVYPKFFDGKPKITNNATISFLNGLFGGLIFGLIFNHNLTLKNKGIVHFVFVAYQCCVILLTLIAEMVNYSIYLP